MAPRRAPDPVACRDAIDPGTPPPVHTSSPILRALITSNGSITFLLQSFFNESIILNKLNESEHTLRDRDPWLELPAGSPVQVRETLLCGRKTDRKYLYARSQIALDNLDPNFRSSLTGTQKPIGKLWDLHRMELFKEIINVHARPAGELAQPLGIAEEALTTERIYRVTSNRKCIMVIAETFPNNL